MIGELILTSFTYDQGRTAINSAFSANTSFTTLSASTFISGATDLYSIFITTADGNDITRVQPGSNITTGGTGNAPTISVVASPSFNSVTASGNSTFSTLIASSLSASTFLSGASSLADIISASSIYQSDGIISGQRMITTDDDIIWRRSPASVGDSFKTLLWSDLDSTSASIYFKCEDHGPIPPSENFLYSKFAIIFSGNGSSFGNGNTFFCMNTVLSSASATTSDAVVKIDSGGDVTIFNGITMNTFLTLTPQSSLPDPSTGKVFFSGSPLFRLMVNTGGTAADWMTLNG